MSDYDWSKVPAFIIGTIIFLVMVYGIYWVFKTGSYFFFYENMVQETIREMVKPEYLK